MTVTASTGIVSGLDTAGIISKLMAVESAPLYSAQSQLTKVDSQISAMGKVKSAIASLQTAAAAISSSSGLYTYAGTVANTSVASVTTGTGATAGSYSLEVDQLAAAEKLRSATGVDPSAGGTLKISLGSYSASNGFSASSTASITVPSGATLSDVATAINNANAGVTATVISGSGGSQLVVTGSSTGETNKIKIESTISGLGYDPANTSASGSMSEVTAAQNAIVKVDGITLANTTSNTVTDGVSGLTINLTGTNQNSPTTITVANSNSGLETKLQAFVTAYNSARSTLKTLSQYDSTGSSSGVLNGDSTITSAINQLRGLLSTVPSDTSSSYQYLSQLGVSASADGTLSLNTATLETAMQSDFSSVAKTVAAYGNAFSTLTTNMNNTDGLITNRISGLNTTETNLNKRISSLQTTLAVIQKRYEAQFTALETALASLQTTSTYLTQQLAALKSSS